MNAIKAIYNFIVGDIIILIGVAIVIAALAVISYVSALAALRIATGTILIVAVLAVLFATLFRETRGR